MTGIKLLTVSDIEQPYLWSPTINERFQKLDLIISCGDLGTEYLEYLADALNAPLYFIFGNHQAHSISDQEHKVLAPQGTNLHERCIVDHTGLILAGIEGSLRYNYGPYQYSEPEMWVKVLQFVPIFLINKVRFGRAVDIFVTHAPAWKILDKNDRPHRGSKAFRWLLQTFSPMLHLFGHVHLYRQDAQSTYMFRKTLEVNTFGFRQLNVELLQKESRMPFTATVSIVKKGF
jgi:Icc-related predicted phosphoesterase